MLNFEFLVPTKLIFGRDAQHQVGELVKKYRGTKVLLHYGGGSIKKSGLYDQVTNSLKKAGIAFVELSGVVPNPRLKLVYEGIDLCRKEGVDFILAVGGGSAIDSAKAIGVGVCTDTDIWDFYEKGLPVARTLPVATILTIPAAGSETSKSSVITNEEKNMKYGLDVEEIRPVFSIMNPELFFTLPLNQIANGVADMMSHIMERYFTNTLSTDLTDGLCEATLKTIIKNAPILIRDPKNYDAWAQIGHCGSMAHTDILGLGRAQEWSCHPMEHELSAIYDIAHGAGLAILTPAWMEYVYNENLPMFVQFAVNVMGVDGSFREPEAIAREGIRRLRDFFTGIGLPETLKDVGIGTDKLEYMARKSTGAEYGREKPLGAIKPLYWKDVLEVYKSAAFRD
ncbi:MAG: iron-containing alcohol dehydrogenase [Synergistaceae bacterium]|jgi:alcohol dehydrogenase YqhD (iron-dependent ADH family)|nr:iron-containing alcohol dehydrogenase [Synergistaceae bacterium]